MDNPSNTSQRIRPILRAMERSIDEARRRRSGAAAPASGGRAEVASTDNTPALDRPIAATPAAAAPSTAATLHSATQAANQSIRPQASTTAPQQSMQSSEGNPDQPVRLKARPKRWLPASA